MIFKGISVAKNYLRPKSAPLTLYECGDLVYFQSHFIVAIIHLKLIYKFLLVYIKKQPSRLALSKEFSENIQQIYWRNPR